MTQKRQAVLQLTLLAIAMAALVILSAVGPAACAPAAPAGQTHQTPTPAPADGVEQQSPTPADIVQNPKLDVILAGLVAKQRKFEAGTTEANFARDDKPDEPFGTNGNLGADAGFNLAEAAFLAPRGVFIRVDRNIADVRGFLEANGAKVSATRGFYDGYIIAEAPLSLINRLARRPEVVSVESKVETYLDPMVKIALAHHEAARLPGESATAQSEAGADGSLETLAVDVEVPFTTDDDFFLGQSRGEQIAAEKESQLRRYLTDRGAAVTGGVAGYYVSARVPVRLLRELSEMPYVGAILVKESQVPGLTAAEASKIVIPGFAQVIAAHEAGITLWEENDTDRPRWFRPGDLVSMAVLMTGDDAATVTANAQQVLQFLTDNGVAGIIQDDEFVGSAVVAVVPVPVLKALARLPEVSELVIQPPGEGPAGPQTGSEAGPQGSLRQGPTPGNPAVTPVTSEGKDKHKATATRQPDSVNTDTCRAVVADVGRPIAPYVFGMGQASASGASGAAGKPDPTITVVETWETISLYNPDLHPPTIDNMTPFHDFVVHGVVVNRTDLLYRADNRKYVYGFVNFRVSEYLKGTGPEYICVTDSPELEPYHSLHTGKEYIIMLETPNDYHGIGLHSDTYDFIIAMGWQVDGKVARLMPEIPNPWRTIITSDRREVDELWLTPEPQRTGLGKATDLATLKGLIRSAATGSQ